MQGRQQIIKSQHMLKCPYDPNHNVPRQTFFKHLDKCKSPYKDLYVQCPFNPFHYPRKQKQLFRKHCRECPQRLKWARLQASKSDEYQILLEPEFNETDLAISVARLSMAHGFQQNNSANTKSWLGDGFNQMQNSRQFEGDDSKSIYFSQVEKSKIMAQSQVWQIHQNSRTNQSVYLSQLKQNPYNYSEYGGKYVPPPQSIYSQQYPQYPPQYPPQYGPQSSQYSPQGIGFGSQIQPMYSNEEFNQQMRYQQFNEGCQQNQLYEQELQQKQWNEDDDSDNDHDKKKKEKKDKREKKEKKEKKDKKAKSKRSSD